jgi:hypothetical protein
MDWLQFLASAAIGSLLGLLAKEGIDWLRAERSHRLELQGRYFDAKLDATIKVIRQLKTSTSTIRGFTTIVKENEETGGWIHPALLSSLSQSFGKSGEKVNEDAAGMFALLGFYYDEELAQLANLKSPTPFLHKLSEFMFNLEKATELQNMLDAAVDAPVEIKESVEKTVQAHEDRVKVLAPELAQFADSLDELANQVIARMRKDFKKVSF